MGLAIVLRGERPVPLEPIESQMSDGELRHIGLDVTRAWKRTAVSDASAVWFRETRLRTVRTKGVWEA